MSEKEKSRRSFLKQSAATVGGLLAWTEIAAANQLGAPSRAYGERSPYEKSVRYYPDSATAYSRTPLQDLYGIITPSSLHYEVHHSGVPEIDPDRHELMIHGLVEKPLIFTMADLRRFPAVSRIHFLECAGNSGGEQIGRPAADPQRSHGLLSCSEWTGVQLRTLLDEAGLKPSATWIVAEGADAGRLARSIPMEKVFDDVLVAYGQNGEAIRPEQGYPVRLIVPGWEGNTNIKWLGRVQAVDRPYMTAYETGHYTDLMPDGKARQFTFVMEAKSVITRPAGGQKLELPAFYEVEGLAWSGRGRIVRVEVSADGGRNWQDAQLNEPVLPKALTRFRMPWRWNGKETSLQSRCSDETGYQQPTREELLAIRGVNATDHYNGIKIWYVHGREGEPCLDSEFYVFWGSWLRVFSLKRASTTLDGRQTLRKFTLGIFQYVLTDSAFLLGMVRPKKGVQFMRRNVQVVMATVAKVQCTIQRLSVAKAV